MSEQTPGGLTPEQELEQASHEIRTVALAEWGWPPSSPRYQALLRWASVMRGAVDTVQAQAQRIAELEAAQGWQPIETAPKDGTAMLVYPHLNGCGAVARLTRYGQWLTLPGRYTVHPTHWMPLPAPPATEDGATR